MSKVTIEVIGIQAQTDGQTWNSKNKTLQDLLETMASREVTEEKLGGYIPDLAQAMAQIAEERIPHLKIVSIEDVDDQDETEVVF